MINFNNAISSQSKNFQYFPFHLVDQSPWPLIISFTLFSMAMGAVAYFQGFDYGGYLLFLGFILTLSTMVLWFKDVVLEGTFLGHHTAQVSAGLNMGFLLFLASEMMVFFSVFWAFFHSSLAPTIEMGSVWPPVGIETLDPYAIPLLNTILLLSSGAFITWGHHALVNGNRKGAVLGTIFTIILAIIFTALQGLEYITAPFTMADSVYGTCFYSATGLHGAHVMIGTLFILVGLVSLMNYHLTDTHHNGLEAAILYWHMVDVVWIFLYMFLYVWGS